MVRPLPLLLLLATLGGSMPGAVHAQSRLLSIGYVPTKRAQVAIWIESADGVFLRTILLTEAVGLRGIGNRPGALQMNSGFRWPYGRREGVLPVWAHRRASAPGAQLFPRVIFQNRWEGYASRQTRVSGQSSEDSSTDAYFCLSFRDTVNDDVDATSCASVFSSDKGRFMTQADVDAGYAEPFENSPGVTIQRALSLTSVYPMRLDVVGGVGRDGPDSRLLASTARAVMPEIDAVTRATAAGDTHQHLVFPVPDEWPDGDYVVFLEIHTERDYDAAYTEAMYPTPLALEQSWDSWSRYGYAYRGQPSVVFRVPIHVSLGEATAVAVDAFGYGEVHGLDGSLYPLDDSIANDPATAPGSGFDRLRLDCGRRLEIGVGVCEEVPSVSAVTDLRAEVVSDPKHSHEWADLRFTAVDAEGAPVIAYEVKVSTSPIVDELSFERAEDAKATTVDYTGLDLCPSEVGGEGCAAVSTCPPIGSSVGVTIGKLFYQTRYYVAVRARGPCGGAGPITSAEFETSEIHFTTVSPCFVATAAFGSPMASEVASLRRFRDADLMPSSAGRALVRTYYALGPRLADAIRSRPTLRALARALLRPFVQVATLQTRSGSH